MIRWSRIWAMAVKELSVALLDRRVRITLIASPILQLTLFGLATTLEVKNIDVGYVNRDAGIVSEQLLSNLGGSPNFRRVRSYPDLTHLSSAIERREVIAGLVLPSDLSRKVASGTTGEIGVVLDGRRINSAQIVAGYLGEIAATTGAALRPLPRAPPGVIVANWYNPNLDYTWFTMPSMIMVIVTVLVLSVSLHAVARERELGTYDTMMILPLTRLEILVGKITPAFFVGVVNSTLFVALIPLLYGVPLRGSLLLLFLTIAVFALAMTGIGLVVSCLTRTQQQAFLGGFLIIVPLILLSGYASPVDNMPPWLQQAARLDPLYHMLIVSKGLFLKDLPAALVLPHVAAMAGLTLASFAVASALFRFRTD
jgi:ABC-2 type transport system permease protein